MSPAVRRDALIAILALAFSAVILAFGSGVPLGTAVRMGPGYVPRLIAIGLFVIGLAITARALFAYRTSANRERSGALPVSWKGVVSIGGGVLAFAALIQPLGLAASAVAAVILTSLAQSGSGLGERLALAGFLSAFSSLVFPIALELPLPLLPHLF